ncbi:MAG: DUF2303 family protein [Alphaproteobacteria bacterium]
MTEQNYADGALAEAQWASATLMSYPENIVAEAVANGIIAAEPVELGDHGLAMALPPGFNMQTFDVRQWEQRPRQITHTVKLTSIESFATYFQAHADSGFTRLYAIDESARDLTLKADRKVAMAVFDDHGGAIEDERFPRVGLRQHVAELVLRPTVPALRWADVLSVEGVTLTQEGLLNLIDDGIGEIAEPDAAVLRDLVADLHAVRTTGVQSIRRTGGDAAVTLTENVALRAGVGSQLTVPEQLTVSLVPWTIPTCGRIYARVKIRPALRDKAITFHLSSAEAPSAIAAERAGMVQLLEMRLELEALQVI